MGVYIGDENSFPENIYQFEETDVVQGGPDGVDNIPLKQLADRTAFLKKELGLTTRFDDGLLFTADSPITYDMAGKHVTAFANAGILNLTIAAVNTFRKGQLIFITSYSAVGSVVYVKTQPGTKFYDPVAGSVDEVMYMHNREFLVLMAMDDHFKVVNAVGNFYNAGEETKSRKDLNNTRRLIGTMLDRSLYPRLWKFVDGLTNNQEKVSEALWFYDAFTYKGCYSTGDLVSTFRLPDERGMHDRMLDLGRGVDLSRTHNFAGGYEADGVKSHTHQLRHGRNGGIDNNANGGGWANSGLNPVNESGLVLANDGGTPENLVKNIGKIFLVKY